MVFAGVYPVEADQYEDLRASLEKLQLNDASLTFEPESSLALGFGFRCGFLGLLHMEIIQERLYREFDMDVITTVPNVSYRITTTQGDVVGGAQPLGTARSDKDRQDRGTLHPRADHHQVRVSGQRHQTLHRQARRDEEPDLHHAGPRGDQFRHAPLGDRLRLLRQAQERSRKATPRSTTTARDIQPSKLVKLDILLNGEPVDALSSLTYTDHAYDFGRKMCEKLKELIPRQQFDIAIQAAIGAKIIATRNGEGRAQGRDGQVLRRRHLAQAQAARKTEEGQEAHAPDRQRARCRSRHSSPC